MSSTPMSGQVAGEQEQDEGRRETDSHTGETHSQQDVSAARSAPPPPLPPRQQWLLQYVRQHSMTSGWDWDADYAWASHCEADPDTLGLMRDTLRSSAPHPLRIGAYRHPLWQRYTRSRVRALRALEQRGYLRSCWVGMPPDVTYGATRCKAWTPTWHPGVDAPDSPSST